MTGPEAQLNTGVAHSARLWNYLLGGTDNFAADREAAEYALALMPELVQSARANREFLGRAVRHLTGAAGIRQFLDVGTGLPTANNTHEVAQADRGRQPHRLRRQRPDGAGRTPGRC